MAPWGPAATIVGNERLSAPSFFASVSISRATRRSVQPGSMRSVTAEKAASPTSTARWRASISAGALTGRLWGVMGGAGGGLGRSEGGDGLGGFFFWREREARVL